MCEEAPSFSTDSDSDDVHQKSRTISRFIGVISTHRRGTSSFSSDFERAPGARSIPAQRNGRYPSQLLRYSIPKIKLFSTTKHIIGTRVGERRRRPQIMQQQLSS